MKQSTIIGFLLVFVTLLLVLGAAVFFLSGRTRNQSQELGNLVATQVAMEATTTREILVREAASENIRKTQEALAGQATQQAGQLPATAESAATVGSQATIAAQSQFLEVIISQPQDQAKILAGQPIVIVLAAQASQGLAEIRVAVNGLPLEVIAGEGQPVLPAAISWTPPAEESYVIQAVAIDSQGQESEPAVVLVSAAFESQEAQEQARQQQLTSSLLATRFPETILTTEAISLAEQPDTTLHQLLVAGPSGNESEAFAREGLVLQAFELLPSAEDYIDYANNILTQPILGYYDPDLETTTVYSDTQPAAPFLYWLAQHQVAHAYQIDRFQFDLTDLGQMTDDQRTAIRALVEGEANWLQYLALANGPFSDSEKVQIDSALAAAASDIFDTLPPFLGQDFTFAYRFGLPFVQAIYGDGDPAALDEVWDRRPESSEQILHPEKYTAQDTPHEISLLPLGDIVGEEWQLIDDGTLGEWRLQQHLNLQLDATEAEEAAAGWGGDRYLLYWHATDDVPLLVLRLSWDSSNDAAQFNEIYLTYLANRSGGHDGFEQDNDGRCWLGSDVVCHYVLAGDQSLVVKAPNLNIANQIFEQLNNAS